jgi:uncharacterized protein with PIN domain
MQVDHSQSLCPDCAGGLESYPILHHMICGYVGPEYDFEITAEGYACPKCQRAIPSGDLACEIVGTSARCPSCQSEMVRSPPPVAETLSV